MFVHWNNYYLVPNDGYQSSSKRSIPSTASASSWQTDFGFGSRAMARYPIGSLELSSLRSKTGRLITTVSWSQLKIKLELHSNVFFVTVFEMKNYFLIVHCCSKFRWSLLNLLNIFCTADSYGYFNSFIKDWKWKLRMKTQTRYDYNIKAWRKYHLRLPEAAKLLELLSSECLGRSTFRLGRERSSSSGSRGSSQRSASPASCWTTSCP